MNTIWRKYALLGIGLLVFGALVSSAQALTLEAAIKKALATHPTLKARQQTFEATVYAQKATAANRWLKADLVAQAERHSDPVAVTAIKGPGAFPAFSRDIYLWELDLSIPLYEGGRVAQAVKLKEFESKVQKSLWRQSAEDLIANVKQVYYQILYLKALSQAQGELLQLLRKQYDEARLKYQAGKIARLDLLYFERALKEEEAVWLSTKANLGLAHKVLGLLIGEKPRSFVVEGKLPKGVSVAKRLSSPLEGYLQARADVKAAAFKLAQAEAALSEAKRAYAPEVALFSSYGRRAGAGFHNDEEVWVAGLQFKWNLFDSGGRRNRVREQQALVLSAQENLRAVRLKAQQEILSALTRLETAQTQINKYQAAEEYARQAFLRESLRYQTGAGSVTDLLSAQEAWLRSKTALLKAYYDLQTSSVAFELATGEISKGYLHE